MTTTTTTTTIKSIACIGAGYVGGPTSAVIAKHCPNIQVHVVDSCAERIALWNSDQLPVFERDLLSIVQECRNKNLFFSTNIDEAIENADVIFLCVNTPTKTFGLGKGKATDLSRLDSAARRIATVAKQTKIVVEKSTVPVKSAEKVSCVLKNGGSINHIVLSNPEFLAEGSAIHNLLFPDRVLIGGESSTSESCNAIKALVDLYANWIPRDKILTMNTWSAELAKLTANAMLAQRVSSVNAISAICEKTGANISDVVYAVGLDTRIGRCFLQPSLGFGGSCFEKDILSLVYLCECLHLKEVAKYWKQVILMNEFQKSRFVQLIINSIFGSLQNKRIAIFGFAYKANTSDTRESPAIRICAKLFEEGAILAIFDPQVPEERIRFEILEHVDGDNKASEIGKIEVCTSAQQATMSAHAIVICTEWEEFKTLDYSELYKEMQRPAYLFDGRLILPVEELKQIGFHVHTIGKCSAN